MRNGYTFVEVLVVTAITLILFAATVPLYGFFSSFSGLGVGRENLVETLRLAREQARAGIAGVGHGVYVSSTEYLLYEGASYATRNPVEDKVYEFPDNVEVTVDGDIAFTLYTGTVSSETNIELIHAGTGSTTTIRVAEGGLIY